MRIKNHKLLKALPFQIFKICGTVYGKNCIYCIMKGFYVVLWISCRQPALREEILGVREIEGELLGEKQGIIRARFRVNHMRPDVGTFHLGPSFISHIISLC
jgi:hypothetical protein